MSALRGKADIALTSGRSPIDPKRTWPPRADQIHRLNESLRIRLICFGWDGTERWITPRLTAFYRVQVVARPCASYRQHGRTAAVSANCKHSNAGRAVSRSPQSKCCCNFQSYCQPDSSRLIWVTLLRPRTEPIKQDVLISSGWLFLARSSEFTDRLTDFLPKTGRAE